MGADIKNLRTRIKSVNSTLHLTKAMGLVASSKIRRANQNMEKSRQYKEAVKDAVRELMSSDACRKSPYLSENPNGKTCLITIAGDRGLAGGYNANIFRKVKEYPDAEIIPIGKYACDKYGSGFASSEDFGYTDAKELAERICKSFADGEYERVGIVCTRYISMMSQEAKVEWILPLEKKQNGQKSGVVFEPDELTVLGIIIPEYVAGVLVACVKESFASEVAARRVAMDSAGKNAQEMLDDLSIAYNRARQGAITQEITEIVAGSGL